MNQIEYEILMATIELHDLLEFKLLEEEEKGFPEVKKLLKKFKNA